MTTMTIDEEIKIEKILRLVEQYGNERAVEAYHGPLHCHRKPDELFADIEAAIVQLTKK